MILVMDTSQSEVFLGLWQEGWQARIKWPTARNLSSEIIDQLAALYKKADLNFSGTEKIIVCSGPGSFTGLRIGLSVANALAYANDIPIIGVEKLNDPETLLKNGLKILNKQKNFTSSTVPFYGTEPKITKPSQNK